MYCWFIFIVCLTLYIINKDYQWILTFGLLKYLLPSKILFLHVCSTIFLKISISYNYRCYSYIFCFHFKGWPKRRIIHIASSVVLQNAENVMICQQFVPGPPTEILQGGTILLWGPRTDWNFSQNCGFELKIQKK